MRSVSRRQFVGATSAAVLAAGVRPAWAAPMRATPHAALRVPLDQSRVLLDSIHVRHTDLPLRALAARALDAARQAGAAYADVRFVTRRVEKFTVKNLGRGPFDRDTTIDVGVRALVKGYWGYASHPSWDPDRVARLGREAAGAAITASAGKPRTVELAPAPVVPDGVWETPCAIDAWTVPFGEKLDYVDSLHAYLWRVSRDLKDVQSDIRITRTERTVASTEGSFFTQTLHQTSGSMAVQLVADPRTGREGGRGSDAWMVRGGGWEGIQNAAARETMPRVLEEADLARRAIPAEIGRYDLVLDAQAMAALVAMTIGDATSLFRAMGYEANRAGTTYVADPLAALGDFRVGAPALTVHATRTLPGGAATVRWDDEGVAPTDVPLVTRGVLTDYQTTRESASWLAPWRQRNGAAVRSSGAAGSETASAVTETMQANLRVDPGTADASFDDLVAGTSKGYAVLGGKVVVDHQCLNGWSNGDMVREIVNGKLGRAVVGGSYVFRTPELWKNLAALGGARSVVPVGVENLTEEYRYITRTVATPPAKITQVAIADFQRRA